MSATTDFKPGGYRYIPSVFQYSAGVAALPGYEIERVRFRKVVPLEEGFRQIAAYIKSRKLPLTAFCACELRSPAPWDDAGFRAFNERYVVTLSEWGIFDGTNNPVARSNLCPLIDPPGEVSFYAFSFAVPVENAQPTFVNSGGGDARPGPEPYTERTIRYRDRSPEGMTEKARFVVAEMERRMKILGFSWADATATQVYTVYDISPFFESELVRRGAAHSGITLHHNTPPVRDLDFEMDCRSVMVERVI